MNKNWLLLKAVLLTLVGFPSVSAVVQAADATTRIEVVFDGNQVFTADQLRSAMSSREHSQATRGSNVTGELQQGLQPLREFLMAEGHLTPHFGKPWVEDGPTGLIFKVHLEEGPLYRLGEIKVTGATVFSERKIIEAFDVKQGDTFRSDAVSRWFERLKEMYTNAGYLDFTPIPRQEVREPDSASSDGTVNLTIDLDEGSRL
jgi:outer membrane protein assembly factor BamA